MSILLDSFFTRLLGELLEELSVLIATAIVLILLAYFRKQLFNLSAWFAQAKVHGSWTTTLETPQGEKAEHLPEATAAGSDRSTIDAHEDVTLTQFFNTVWGTAVLQSGSYPVYKLRGQIVGEKLTLLFRKIGDIDSGSICLKVMPEGRMEGYEVGFNSQGKLYADVYKWRKRVEGKR